MCAYVCACVGRGVRGAAANIGDAATADLCTLGFLLVKDISFTLGNLQTSLATIVMETSPECLQPDL